MQREALFLFCVFLITTVLSEVCIDGECSNDKSICIEENNWSKQSLQNLQSSSSHKYGSFVDPIPLESCELVDVNEELLSQFNVDEDCFMNNVQSYLCGESLPTFASSYAHRYGGHQFGVWAGQLGDGRALSWGKVNVKEGTKLFDYTLSKSWDWQVKGSGKTPYSRDGDGRAVLRSSIREYLGSWAAYNLGIPTSLALGLVKEIEPTVVRDPLYNGNHITEQSAVTLRISPSWLRFGSFQILHKEKNTKAISELLGFTIDNHFTFLLKEGESAMEIFKDNSKLKRAKELANEFLIEVVLKTADLMAHWKANGFCHGVINTDNMSILGLTIDFGPFAFMDEFDQSFICNGSDDKGRYKFATQENIGMWNLKHFAESLGKYLSIAEQVNALGPYFDRVKNTFSNLMAMKLGFEGQVPLEVDQGLIEALLEIMEEAKVDYHYFFRLLSLYMIESDVPPKLVVEQLPEYSVSLFNSWWKLMCKRRQISGLDANVQRRNMLRKNPTYILRNHIAEKAIQDAIMGDYSTIQTLKRILKKPTIKDSLLSEEEHQYYSSPPDKSIPKVIVTCSS